MDEKFTHSKDRLKLIRKESGGLSQADIAEMLSIPGHKIKSIEIGKTKISVDIALLLEEKFNYSFKWILTGIGEPKNKVIQKHENIHKGHLHTIETEHCDIIKRFRNKQVAKEINEKLLDLEAIGEKTFQKAVNYIDVLWDAATVAIDDYETNLGNPEGGKVGKRIKNGTTDP